MLYTGRDLYEEHTEICAEWGIGPLPAWADLSIENRAGWELMAAEYAEKCIHDREAELI